MGVNSHPRMNDSDGSYRLLHGKRPGEFQSDIHAVMEGRGIINVLTFTGRDCDYQWQQDCRTNPALNDLLNTAYSPISALEVQATEAVRGNRRHPALFWVSFSRPSWDRELGSSMLQILRVQCFRWMRWIASTVRG